MSKIKIMTDSSVQLSPEEIEKYGITVVPLSVTIDGHTYTDGVDITRADFIQKMDEAEKLPKTSQPPVGLFVERMEELTADGSEVLGIFMAKTLSGTVDSARQAAEMVAGKITVIDCGYTDRSQGYYCIEAAKDAEAGKEMDEILAHLDQIGKNMYLEMMVPNLQNILAGGRLGKWAGRAVSALNFHVGKVKYVGISYVDTRDKMEELAQRFKEVNPDLEILVQETSPIIITHAGHGAYAVMFYTE
ncbi:DegV family protein [Lactobacillus delbrueckii subsp. lactis]|uniref:DegV family protein n=1 Tax=Lactobacillus delbrueckii TaxID=1584 RepID=UPI001E33F8E6|nr:DegV family protein [Lactobacillus delbrueckii]MCD5596783.1 DegV family protein [Lactobacillus delbrueckii subsp. lactis]